MGTEWNMIILKKSQFNLVMTDHNMLHILIFSEMKSSIRIFGTFHHVDILNDLLIWNHKYISIISTISVSNVKIHNFYQRCLRSMTGCINTLRPRRNGHFADNISRHIFFDENVCILINISLKFVPKGPINNIPSLVKIMAWCHPGDKPLSEPMIITSPMYICIAQPQWVKTLWWYWIIVRLCHFIITMMRTLNTGKACSDILSSLCLRWSLFSPLYFKQYRLCVTDWPISLPMITMIFVLTF